MVKQILIIDPDASFSNALAVYLERQFYEVYKAHALESALTYLDSTAPEVVISDPFFEKKDVFGLLRALKNSDPTRQLIVLTHPNNIDRAMSELGNKASDYLTKPVNSKALDIALEHARKWIYLQFRSSNRGVVSHLKYRNNLYEQLFDEVPCFISVQDFEFRITAANRKFKTHFGDVVGEYCYKVYKHRTAPCSHCPVAMTFKDGNPHSTEEVVTAHGGRQFHVVTWTAPIRDSHGQITQVIEMSTDITQIRHLQNHLEALGIMLGSMSHGVKGMLTALDGGIYQMESGMKRKDEQRIQHAFGIIKDMSARIRDMVLDILYYAKSREVNYQKIAVQRLIEDISRTVAPTAEKNKIVYEITTEGDLGEIYIDSHWFHSALVNILENAIDACREDASKPHHRVTFSVKALPDDGIVFDISDNGIGVDRETREKMFTLFFSSKGAKGTGLGLFIANHVIQQHGGSVEVESEPGKGSRFIIRVPRFQENTYAGITQDSWRSAVQL